MAVTYEIGIGEKLVLSIDSNATYTTTFKAESGSGSYTVISDYNQICSISSGTGSITITGKALGRLTITVKATSQSLSATDTATITITNTKKPTIKIEKMSSLSDDIDKLKEVLEYFISKS